MVTLYGILNVGARGVNAAQVGLDVTGHNVANANTEGYTRQRVVQKSAEPITNAKGSFGQGVETISIERLRDQFLETQIQRAQSDYAFNEEMERIFSRVESIINDPLNKIGVNTDPADATGINNVLSRFFRTIQELSLTPESPEVRTAAVENAQIVAETFNSTHDQMYAMLKDLNDQVSQFVNKINSLANQIASINHRIASLESQTNVEANDFRDERDRIIGQLSKMVPITVIEGETGITNVTIAGQWLVDNFETNPLKLEVVDKVEGIDITSVRLGDDGLYVMDDVIKKGQFGAVLDARDRLVPTIMSQIDTLAAGVIREINRIHSGSSGLEGYSQVQSDFDVPTNAAKPNAVKTLTDIFITLNSSSKNGNGLFPIQDGSFKIRVTDEDGDLKDTFEVQVRKDDTLFDLVERIDRSDGVVKTARSALTFDPVFAQNAKAKQGATAAELNGPLSGIGVLQNTPVGETPGVYSFEIHLRDESGQAIDSDVSTGTVDPYVISFNSTGSLQDLANAIQAGGGGKIRANLVPSASDKSVTVLKIETIDPDNTISIQNDTSGIIQAMDFPLTDPTLPLIGGTATSTTSTFSGLSTDSFIGSGSPNFSPAFPGPPPSVIREGTLELVVVDNSNVPTVHTLTVGAGNIESMSDLEAAIEALDPNLSVEITSDNRFVFESTANRSFFFQNDQTGLVDAMKWSDYSGFGELAGQPFKQGSFEIVVANNSGVVTQIVEVPVQADPSVVGGVLTLQGIVDAINSSASGAAAPIRAIIVKDPTDPTRSQLQIEAGEGFEFTFRSDDSLLLSALGFTEGPVLAQTLNKPIVGGEFPIGIGDNIGGTVRAHLDESTGITITTAGNDEFSFVGDTSYFLSAAGINGLFQGNDARSMRINQDIIENTDLLATSGDGNVGNNEAAVAIAELEDKRVINGKSPGEFYRSLVAVLGSEGEHVRQSMSTNATILNELKSLQTQNSGVSLDEESINIIRFQQAFQAAARIISTVDELLNIVINQLGR